jgi:tRNA C32,U32 (ribose-2'-O)-methylase TrmJ
MRNIKAMLNRADLTEQDISTLHGMVKAIKRSVKPSK